LRAWRYKDIPISSWTNNKTHGYYEARYVFIATGGELWAQHLVGPLRLNGLR